MLTARFIKETADRVLKSFVQGYLASFLLASGITPNLDKFLTLQNLQAAVLMAILSLCTAFGLRPVGSDTGTSQIIR